MNTSFFILSFLLSMVWYSTSACDRKDNEAGADSIVETSNVDIMISNQIRVNSKTFTATLLDNNSAKAFVKMLPMTIKMVELNGNEKYYDLPKSLPANSSNPRTILNGDIMAIWFKNISSIL